MHCREHGLECSCIQVTSEVIRLSFVFLLDIWKHSYYIFMVMGWTSPLNLRCGS